MKIIIGSGENSYEGWISTNQNEINLLDRDSFVRFLDDQKVTAILAEHVWEHLTLEEGFLAAKNCYEFLEPGGYIRVAVPDGNFKNPEFQNLIKIGGPGPKDHPAYSHKIVYDYQTFVNVFEQADFDVHLLEYCDEQEVFHYKYWNAEDGHIGRSLRYDTRNSREKIGMPSIILDAYKPFKLKTKE